MCDYSLHSVATRPAQIEDRLVTTKFKKSITRGFAAVGEPQVAVCLLPGTEIVFDENVEREPSFGIGHSTSRAPQRYLINAGRRERAAAPAKRQSGPYPTFHPCPSCRASSYYSRA
jgi:hypothetical protein